MFKKLFNKNSGSFNPNSVATSCFKNNNTYKESSPILNGCYLKKSYASYTSLNYPSSFGSSSDRQTSFASKSNTSKTSTGYVYVRSNDRYY